MKLSKNFSLNELTKSYTAIRLGIDNTPNSTELANLRRVAENILQPVRDHYGKSFTPSSGYRGLDLNRAVNSSDTSQHVLGCAVDFEVPGVSNYELAKWINDHLIFDQLILEFYYSGKPYSGWVHCSYSTTNRNEVLTINKYGAQYGLIV